MKTNPLGKASPYKNTYDPSLLFPIPRAKERNKYEIDVTNMKGLDIWNCYEFSYLGKFGKPEVGILRLSYPADSQFIVESKSLKLYLNSFNMSYFKDSAQAVTKIKEDLSAILETPFIEVLLERPGDRSLKIKDFSISKEELLDNLPVRIDTYHPDCKLLHIRRLFRTQTITRYSHLLKTNCPITGQPDWATVYIRYTSNSMLDDASLLRYIVSYRNHEDYHEICCEKIFSDIFSRLQPQSLLVQCFYTRRGGIDINPLRFYNQKGVLPGLDNTRAFRQ